MDLWPYKDTVSFFMKSANFIMLYTGDFVLRYYVGFSQIRSHIGKTWISGLVCKWSVFQNAVTIISGHKFL